MASSASGFVGVLMVARYQGAEHGLPKCRPFILSPVSIPPGFFAGSPAAFEGQRHITSNRA